MLEKYEKLLEEKLTWGSLATFVPNKDLGVYNWFYYKEGFSRELVIELLRMFRTPKDGWVLDPFCGSGTTLLACMETGINSIGVDTLPIALFASKVKTASYTKEDIEDISKIFKIISKERFRKVGMEFPPIMKRGFSRFDLDEIAFLMDSIRIVEPEKHRDFFLLGLLNASLKSSYIWKDGGVLKIKKRRLPPVKVMFRRVVKGMIKDAEDFSIKGCKSIVNPGDARKLKLENNSMDCIITSPPYLNNIDYTKVYSIENFFIGKPSPSMRSYIGLESQESGGGIFSEMGIPKNGWDYFRDMEQVLREMHRVLKEKGKACIIVGNAYFKEERMIVDSDLILSLLAEKAGFAVERIIILNKRHALEERTRKMGILRESAIILRK